MKKLLLTMMSLTVTLSMNADSSSGVNFEDELFQYSENYFGDFAFGNGLFVSAKDKEKISGDIVIPDSVIHGGIKKPVIAINSEGFCNTNITSVVIPNTVLQIGGRAFADCPKLEKIVLPSRVYRIGDAAFIRSTNLKTIESHMYFPSPIVETQWMKENGIIATVLIPKGSMSFYQSEEEWAKMGKLVESDKIEIDKTLFSYELRENNSVAVYPYSWNIRGDIEIPSSIVIDGQKYTVSWMEFFENCRRITNVKIPNTVRNLCSFNNCERLQALNVPANTGMTYGVYEPKVYGCNELKTITVEDDNEYFKAVDGVLMSKNGEVICGYPSGREDKEYSIPEGVKSMVSQLFRENDKLEKVVLPSTITEISYDCFNNAKAIKTVEIKGPVTSIASRAFYGSSLETITIPETVETIGEYAFECNYLKSVTSKSYSPAEISPDIFSSYVYENAVLYVPSERASYYKEASGWQQFTNMVEIDMPDIVKSDNPFDNIKENQMVIGYYTSSSLKDYIDYDKTPYFYLYYPIDYSPTGKYKMCIKFTKAQRSSYVGNSITSMRFAISNTRFLSDVRFWIGSSREKEDLYQQEVATIKSGWNTVELANPFLLENDVDSIFIGIDYQQNDWNAPILFRETSIPMSGAGYVYGPYMNTNGIWVDAGESHKVSIPIQCIIEGGVIPQYDLRIVGERNNRYFKQEEGAMCEVYLQNWGKYTPGDDFELTYYLKGKEIGKFRLAEGSSGVNQTGSIYGALAAPTIPIDTPVGECDMKVAVSLLKGKAPNYTAEDTIPVRIKVYANDMGRQKSIIECRQTLSCPNTASTDLKAKEEIGDASHYILINEHFNDELACMASQAYLMKDDLTGVTNYSVINRWDNGAYYRDYTTLPSFADIHVSSSYDNNHKTLFITIKGTRNEDFVLVEKQANLTVLLTEDDVIFPIFNDMEGIWDDNYRHNALLRTNVSAVWGDPIQWNGNHYEMRYKIKLDDNWVKDNMHIIAFMAKPFTGKNYGEINLINCNDFDVRDSDIIEMGELVSGDADGNREVNHNDIDFVNNYIMTGKEPNGFNWWNAEMNNDGKINVADIVKIINMSNNSAK